MFKKVLVAIAATAMVASATPVLSTDGVPGYGLPLLSGQTREANLQEIFDKAAKDNISDVKVLTDEIKDDRFWSIGSTQLGNATILIEIAGNANKNTFGLYDVNDPANKMQIFSGNDSQGKKLILEYFNGTIYLSEKVAPGNWNLIDQIVTPNYFGFYMGTPNAAPNTFFYSDYALNGKNDQMVTYQGKGEFVSWPGQVDDKGKPVYAPWGAGEFVLAWEDLPLSSSDKDYNDMVILVESIYPIPEPTMIGLLGLGLIGLVFYRRKK